MLSPEGATLRNPNRTSPTGAATGFGGPELQQSLPPLKSTLDSIVDGVLVLNLDGAIAAYNAKFVQMWRITPEVLASRDDDRALAAVLEQLVDPGALRKVRELYGEPERESFDILTLKDERIVERYSQPQRVEGKRVGRVWSFRDVTERVCAAREQERLLVTEHTARASAERARAQAAFLAEASRVLASSLDYEVTLGAVAQLAVPLLADWCTVDVLAPGASVRRFVASAPARAALVRELARFTPKLERGAGAGEVILTGVTVLCGGITEADLRIDTGVPLPAGSDDPEYRRVLRALRLRSYVSVPLRARGCILGALTCCRDRERGHDACDLALAEELGRRAAVAVDNARLHKEAEDAIGIRDEFLGLAAHELRTPCTALLLSVQALARYARTGKLVLEGGSPNRATHMLEASERRALALSAEVITNLLSNAIKYGQGRPIEVRAQAEGDVARLTVRDHGIGLDPDWQSRAFARFERAVSSRNFGGLGLGLYLVQRICGRLGGRVDCSSAAGQGSTFTVTLPLGGSLGRVAP